MNDKRNSNLKMDRNPDLKLRNEKRYFMEDCINDTTYTKSRVRSFKVKIITSFRELF